MKDRDPANLLYTEPSYKQNKLDALPVCNAAFDRALARIDALEATLLEHEEYFKTIESILTKIQAVYEAMRNGGV